MSFFLCNYSCLHTANCTHLKQLHSLTTCIGYNASMKDISCTLSALKGTVVEVVSKDSSGLRTLRLQTNVEPFVPVPAIAADVTTATIPSQNITSSGITKTTTKSAATVKKEKKKNTKTKKNNKSTEKTEPGTKDNHTLDSKPVVDDIKLPNIKAEKEISIEDSSLTINTTPIVSDANVTEDSKIAANVTEAATEANNSLNVVNAEIATAPPVAVTAVNINALDVDAFFNSMASELMTTTGNF